uniref:Ribosomal protein S7 n=1 Tax=Udotea flabellum TaxID=170437 RepID=A0A386B1T4_9CHLO|nr:ribosomal protein S7 [Udotea flabellum]AYC65671.1 ribosomal protein S7 [Udotea flabellum]
MARTKRKKKKKNSDASLVLLNQRLLRHGKKKLAYRILQKSLINIQNQTQQDPFLIIEKAIRNTTPSVEIQTRRIGGAVYPIPVELGLDRGIPRGIGWILNSAKKRSGNTFDANLANEFIDASKKIGNAFHKKEEVHKIADANARFVKKGSNF